MNIQLDNIDIKLLELKYINKLSDNKCAELLNISKKDIKKKLDEINNKIAIEVVKNRNDEFEENIENKKENICSFRCAICGKLYEIDYKNEKIQCPLCYSTKII